MCLSAHDILAVRAIKNITKDTIALTVRFAAILKWHFSLNCLIRKLERFYLPRQGQPSLVDAYSYSACNVSYTLRYMFAYAESIAFNYYSILENVLSDERFCISTVYIIRMSFSASNNFYYCRYSGCPARVCVCLFLFFCRHVHLDPDVRVHRGTENSFIYYNYNRDFC